MPPAGVAMPRPISQLSDLANLNVLWDAMGIILPAALALIDLGGIAVFALTGALLVYIATIPVAIYNHHPRTKAFRAARSAPQ